MDSIAIIGAAFRLPGAHTLDELHDGLFAGRDSVRAPSEDRVIHAGGTPGTDYVRLGYLDRVDQFDHQFFGISLGEAELMDPHQRLGLQLVHEAIENACYAPGRLRGTSTAVIVSAPNPSYASLYSENDPQQILGSLPAAMAARIAYLFDFAGPSLTVDTACSGSLVAVALAVEKLRSGQADLAIAGGVSVESVLHLRETDDPLLGVISQDGVCRPFDAAADGTVGGEGGGFVLLKRLQDAMADGDHVHAVLRGIAVNHNGASATSMSAPSSRAQAAAITAAWRDAEVTADSIGYIECHGSGTPLGDVIEVDGLRRAFGSRREPCPIGTIKANVGHLDHAAGMAGLFKVLTSLRNSARYPTVHFESPNQHIDFTGVTVQAESESWPRQDGHTRIAGLSSFGLTGTNVHAVIEEPPVPIESISDYREHVVTVSAKTPAALERYAGQLIDFLDEYPHPLEPVAYALNNGRDDHPYRWAFTVRDNKELAESLRLAKAPERAVRDAPVVLLFSGDTHIDDETWAGVTTRFPSLDPASTATMARQLALYELLGSLGLTATRLIGSGFGNTAIRVARERMSLDAALAEAPEPTDHVDLDGLRRAVRGIAADNAVVVEMGDDGALSRGITELTPDVPVVRLLSDDGVLAALARLYELGVTIDWAAYHADSTVARIEAPTYPFEPVSCWCGPAPEIQAAPVVASVNLDVEQAIAEMWSRALRAPEVHADSDYFELGGTSIAGIGLLRQVETSFGIHLTFADLYDNRTVGRLASLVAQRQGDGSDEEWTIPVVPRDGRLPLSVNQEQLWYIDQLGPGTALYNIPTDLRYRGFLNRKALQEAFTDLIQRHEILRSRFVVDDDGRPRVLLDAPEPRLAIVHTGPNQLAELVEAEATKPFDLAAGPLVRGTLFAVADDDHLLLCTWHHSIFDGWTPRIFTRDLSEFYSARLEDRAPDLPELPVQYVDFAAWQRAWLATDRREQGLEYWRKQLAGVRPQELPIDRPRPPVESHAGTLLDFSLPDEHAVGLREFSRREGVTTFVTMMAVMDALMYLWAGHEDVVIGAATTGRTNPATHELIGYFNNLLPFRTKLDGDVSFRELVRRCSETVTGVLDHEEIPFGDIVADLRPKRDASRHPFFTVGYTHQNTATHSAELAGMTVAPAEEGGYGIAPGTSKVDLTVGLSDQDGGPMRGYLEYATDLFDESTMRRVLQLYQDIVAKALADPDRPLAEFAPGPTNIWESMRQHPADRVAIVDGDRTYTYGDIVRMARDKDVPAGRIVPVLAERGVEMIVGWLSVLAAGSAFVPLDPAAPRERTESIRADVGDQPAGDLAYVTFTSGSTGRPQGCEISHTQLLGLIRWFGERFNLSEKDNVAQVLPPGFDGAILEVLAALCYGTTIHVLPDVRTTPAALSQWLVDHQITVLIMPTAMAELFLAEEPACPALRVLVTGGDRLRVRPSRARFLVVNVYGLTECTIASTYSIVTPDGAGVPDIGYPIPGNHIYILDQDGNPAEVGELHIGGAAVGRGYHQQPGRTATRFVADPFGKPGARMYRTGDLAEFRADGSIGFHGRGDDQIALRGHRIEPAEIERVLVAQPGVREALVLAEDLPSGGRRLVAHVAGDRVPGEAAMVAAIAERLPSHMVPSRVVAHAVLPKTPNGKFDRTSLSQEKAMTATDVLTQIWSDLLGRDTIGLDEDFFQIGGDSVLSVGVAARAARAGLAITPQDVLRYPTLRGLAGIVTTIEEKPVVADGPVAMTPLIQQMLDAADDPNDFVVIELLEVGPDVNIDSLRRAIDHVTEIQEPMRYRFRHNSLGWRIEQADQAGHVMDTVVLPPMGPEDELAMLADDAAELAREIDITRGPLLRIRFYDRGPERGGVMLWIVHHFVHDEISTVPLLEDLMSALTNTAQAPRPPAWRAWTQQLLTASRSDELAGELTYWTSVLRRGESVPTAPLAASPSSETHVINRSIKLDGGDAMLTVPGEPSREAMLAVIACAWSRWRGEPNAFISTISYGKPNIFRPDDRSRSVGWFTTTFPLLLPVEPDATVQDALPAIANTVRAVPNDGVGYGVLRQFSPDTAAVSRLRSLPEPQLMVEHKVSGVNSIRMGDAPLRIKVAPLGGASKSLLAVTPIVVASAVIDGMLELYLAHDGRYDADELSKFVDHIEQAAIELAESQ